MLRGKENGDISRKIHVQVYVFIAREWVYTDPPQEIHFLYSENPTSCDRLGFQTYMRLLSSTI